MNRFVLVSSLALVAAAVVTVATIGRATADSKPAAPAAPSCKAWGGGKCCDPAVTAHLPREAIFGACGESDATYLGEAAGKDSCKFYFKSKEEKEADSYVQVYVPQTKEPMTEPNDPFFVWKKVGRAFYTEKGSSPKSAPMMNKSTGLWMGGKGYMVSVNASTAVCTKAEAKKLALKIK